MTECELYIVILSASCVLITKLLGAKIYHFFDHGHGIWQYDIDDII